MIRGAWPYPAPLLTSPAARALMAEGIWQGHTYLWGRASAYGATTTTGDVARPLSWHPDVPVPLTDGHDGPTIGASVYTEESPDGLDMLFLVAPEHVTALVLALYAQRMDLSVQIGPAGTLQHVALVTDGADPGAEAYVVATPWEVWTRDLDGVVREVGPGPAVFEPTPAVDALLATQAGVPEPGALVTPGAEVRGVEHLLVPVSGLELRAASGSGVGTLEGLCVPYDVPTYQAGPSPEVFRFGALASATADPSRVRLRDNNHDMSGRPVGVATALTERPDGLHGRFRFYDTPQGRSAWQNVQERTYGGLSVGFVSERERTRGGMREVLAARLDHVSLVDEPAYDRARFVAPTSATV
jgi:HK97 family phage prohead protease